MNGERDLRVWRLVSALEECSHRGIDPDGRQLAHLADLPFSSLSSMISEARSTICRDLGLSISCTQGEDVVYRYRLTGEWLNDKDRPDIKNWALRRRLPNIYTQLVNLQHSLSVAVAGVDLRTREGRSAASTELTIRQAIERIEFDGIPS